MAQIRWEGDNVASVEPQVTCSLEKTLEVAGVLRSRHSGHRLARGKVGEQEEKKANVMEGSEGTAMARDGRGD